MTMIINMFKNIERIPINLCSRFDQITSKTEKLLTIEDELIKKLQAINLD